MYLIELDNLLSELQPYLNGLFIFSHPKPFSTLTLKLFSTKNSNYVRSFSYWSIANKETHDYTIKSKFNVRPGFTDSSISSFSIVHKSPYASATIMSLPVLCTDIQSCLEFLPLYALLFMLFLSAFEAHVKGPSCKALLNPFIHKSDHSVRLYQQSIHSLNDVHIYIYLYHVSFP